MTEESDSLTLSAKRKGFFFAPLRLCVRLYLLKGRCGKEDFSRNGEGTGAAGLAKKAGAPIPPGQREAHPTLSVRRRRLSGCAVLVWFSLQPGFLPVGVQHCHEEDQIYCPC